MRALREVSLLWRVFAVNIAVFVVGYALLAWTPVTVHRVARPGELLLLGIGLIALLAVDLTLLGRAFSPLRTLATRIAGIDPSTPGRRIDLRDGAGKEVRVLTEALNALLDRLDGERLEAGRRILAAQEAERTRIARELHDEVGQTLTAIALRAERAAGEAAGTHPAALAEITSTALHSLEDVRRIGHELRPEALDDLGLVNALIALCTRVGRQGGLRVRRHLEWHLPALAPETELVIYRTAQEALTNVMRHAGATEVFVSLACQPGTVVLRVSDNGVGLPEGVRERGLRGIQERAIVIGGELEIGWPEQGTEITLRVPAD